MTRSEHTNELYVLLPADIEARLQENGADLVQLLRNEGVSIASRSGVDLAAPEQGSRSVVLVLLGTAAIITSLTPVLTRLISAIASRPIVANEVRLRPVETSAGEVVHGADGQPIMHWIEEKRVVATSPALRAEPTATSFEGPMGIKFSYAASMAAAPREKATEPAAAPNKPGVTSAIVPKA